MCLLDSFFTVHVQRVIGELWVERQGGLYDGGVTNRNCLQKYTTQGEATELSDFKPPPGPWKILWSGEIG